MKLRNLFAAATAATVLGLAGAAQAALVFVGSWQINDGPTDPVAMSAQQVAALLFGGDPAEYFISTAGDDASDVNLQAHYVILGLPDVTYLGGQGETEVAGFELSAYAFAPDVEDRFINYAFVERAVGPGIPEPATWALLIGGFGLAGGVLRRRRAALA
jgi:hypothetical protein